MTETLEIVPPERDLWLPFPAEGETWDPHTVHTHYFHFTVPDAAIGSYFYFRYQPGVRSMQGGVCIWEGHDNLDVLEMAYHDYQTTMGWPRIEGNTITTDNGMRLDFIEPGRQVR